MKKYNVKNYIRYKEDVKACMPDEEFDYFELTRSNYNYVSTISRKHI